MKSQMKIGALILCLVLPSLVRAQDIFSIPNPREDFRWVVDATNSIPEQDMNRVNSFCEDLNRKTGAELAVVVIDSTGGEKIESYALRLFNHWGIGNRASDNGILFLIAKKDRKMRMALGDAIDVPQQERMAARIMDEEVKPRFRQNKYSEGVYAGARMTALRLFGIEESEFGPEFGPPPKLPANAFGVSRNKFQRVPQAGGRRNRGGGGNNNGILPMMFVGGTMTLGGIGIFGGRYWLRYRRRFCEVCGDQLILLEEDEDDQFLSEPEQTEERIGSVDYDIWACLDCEEVMKVRYGSFFSRYSNCPQCGYKTKYKIKATIVRATTYRRGRVRVEERCVSCSYDHEYTYSTPKKSQSSSSSFGSSSGGGGFGGGGGSFGGGSSSGGGATSSW